MWRRVVIALIMEAIRTSETSVYSNETTRRYIPDGCNLRSRRREDLKSHISGADRLLRTDFH